MIIYSACVVFLASVAMIFSSHLMLTTAGSFPSVLWVCCAAATIFAGLYWPDMQE